MSQKRELALILNDTQGKTLVKNNERKENNSLVRTGGDEESMEEVIKELQLLQQRFLTGRGRLTTKSKDEEIKDLVRKMKETDEDMKEMINVIECSFILVLVVGIIMMLKRMGR
jgi:predicted CopG family antitoxin